MYVCNFLKKSILVAAFIYLASRLVSDCLSGSLSFSRPSDLNKVEVSAFIRFKNEMKTLPAMLKSIDGVFDRIVMIYSNEPDDGSIAYARRWCQKRTDCEIYLYPHAVIPSHDARYSTEQVPPQNTLAAYYNFGLSFFKPEEYVVKIDADQVYLTKKLQETIHFVRKNEKIQPNIIYGIQGYNTYVFHNQLVVYGLWTINGGMDHFVTKRKYILSFESVGYIESACFVPDVQTHILPGRHWFHFMKSLKENGQIRSLEEADVSERLSLSSFEQHLFETEIRPLLRRGASPYQHVGF